MAFKVTCKEVNNMIKLGTRTALTSSFLFIFFLWYCHSLKQNHCYCSQNSGPICRAHTPLLIVESSQASFLLSCFKVTIHCIHWIVNRGVPIAKKPMAYWIVLYYSTCIIGCHGWYEKCWEVTNLDLCKHHWKTISSCDTPCYYFHCSIKVVDCIFYGFPSIRNSLGTTSIITSENS